MKTGPGTSRARRASRLSRTAPDVMHGHHSSLLAALREEDTDDEFDDDDAFAFAPKGEGTPSTPGGAHRVFAAGKESMDSPTSPLVTHTEPHTKTYGFALAPPPPPPPLPDIRVFLANGASAPVEVLRNHVVTSLTLKLDRDAAESPTAAAARRPGGDAGCFDVHPRRRRRARSCCRTRRTCPRSTSSRTWASWSLPRSTLNTASSR